MSHDSLVDEVRAAREAYASRFNHDMDAIFRHLKEQERKSGRTFVTLPPRPAKFVEVAVRSKREGVLNLDGLKGPLHDANDAIPAEVGESVE